MPTAAEELLLKISGDATGGQKAIKDITDQVDGIGTKGHDAGAQLKEAFENPQGALQTLGVGIKDNLLSQLGSVTGVATGVVGVLTAVGVASFELAERAAAVGGNLNDMSEKTGVSVEALSRLQNASHVAGSDLGTMTNALFLLQKGLGEDGEKVSAGLHKIGLTTDELKAAGPDQYMALIAEHFKATTDPAARAAAAMEIFGKAGKEIIPTLMKLDEALKETADIDPWTTQQAAAAEQFEMQMASLKEHVSAVSTSVGRDLIPAAVATVDALEWLGVRLQHIIDLGGLVSGTYHAVQGVLGETALAAETAGAKQDVINNAIRLGAPQTITYGDAVKYVNEQFADLHPSQDKAVQSAEAWIKKLSETAAAGIKAAAADADLTEGLARMGIVRGAGIAAANEYTAALNKAAEEAKRRAAELKRDADAAARDLKASLNEEIGLIHDSEKAGEQAAAAIGKSFAGMPGVLKGLSIAMGDTQLSAKQFADFGLGMMNDKSVEAAAHMATLRDRSKEWGRDLDQLAGSLERLAQISGASFGGMVKDIAQVIGALSVVDKSANTFKTSIGTRDKVGAVTGAVGMVEGVAAATDGGGIKGIAGGAMSGMAMGAAIGSVVPVIGTAIGAAVGAIGGAIVGIARSFGASAAEKAGRQVEGDFEQQFGGFQGMMDAVGSAYAATGRTAQQAQADVKALMDAEKMGGDAAKLMVDKITGAINEQKQDAVDLNTAIQTYGFSIEQLGPAMQKQNLDGQAQQLINDWRLLVGSGIEVVTVDQKMADSTWNYLQMAKKTGQEVPEAMKPVIQSMLDQGVFTDENGEKITEMKDLGVTFSQTMTQGFDKVVQKLQELLEKMGKVPAALAAASGPINVDVNLNGRWNIPDVPDWGGAQAAGGDYVVTRPTLFLAGEAGPERARFSGANRVGADQGVVVNVTVEGNVWAERDLADAVAEHINDRVRAVTPLSLRRSA